MPGIRPIGYADDLAIIFTGRDLTKIKRDIDATTARVARWFVGVGLDMAEDKT